MRGLFIDPAGKSNAKGRGYAVIEWWPDNTAPYLQGWFSGGLPDERALQWGALDVAVCEAQFPAKKSSKQSLITLGAGAGFLLGQAPAPMTEKFFVPVFDWKDAIIPGFANAPGEMYTNNLRKLWPQIDNEHCLDATGLGFAWAQGTFTKEQLKKWRYA